MKTGIPLLLLCVLMLLISHGERTGDKAVGARTIAPSPGAEEGAINRAPTAAFSLRSEKIGHVYSTEEAVTFKISGTEGDRWTAALTDAADRPQDKPTVTRNGDTLSIGRIRAGWYHLTVK